MSGSVLYLGQRGPLFEMLKVDFGSHGMKLSLPPPQGGEGEQPSMWGLGRLAEIFKGFSLIVLGRGHGGIAIDTCISALEEVGVPGLLLDEDAFVGANVLEAGAQLRRVPIIVAAGMMPGLGHALLAHLQSSGVIPGKVMFTYDLHGLGPISKEALRAAFGRGVMELHQGLKKKVGIFSPILSSGDLSYPSGEIAPLCLPGSDMPQGISAKSQLRVHSKRLKAGLLSLGGLPGNMLLGKPGSVPNPEQFLTGKGGDILGKLSPSSEGLGIRVTVQSDVRRASCFLEGQGAVSASALGSLADILLKWDAPLGVHSPLHPKITEKLWEGLEERGVQRPAIEDAAHSVDARLARRLHILAS